MIASPAPVRLGALAARVAPVELPDGGTYPVRVYRAAEYQLLTELRGLPATEGRRADELLLELCRRAVPTAPATSIDELEPAQILAVIALATGHADAVIAELEAAAAAAAALEGTSGNA